MIDRSFMIKLKHKILYEFNIIFFKKLNLTISQIDNFFGYYNGHIYELVDHIYRRYGPHGLREEMNYILEYLEFLMNKLKNNDNFSLEILVTHYFKLYYIPNFKRNKIHISQLSLPLNNANL